MKKGYNVTVQTSGGWKEDYIAHAETAGFAALDALDWWHSDYPNTKDEATVVVTTTLDGDLVHSFNAGDRNGMWLTKDLATD